MRKMTFTSILTSVLFCSLFFLLAGCAENSKQPSETSANKEAAPSGESADDGVNLGEEATMPATEKTEEKEEASTPAPSEAKPKADVEKSEPASKKISNKVMLGGPELTQGIPGKGKVTVEQIKQWLDRKENHEVLEIELPLGLSEGKIPPGVLEANPLTRAKIELGRQLFFETRLSADGTVSCASCHRPDHGYAADTQFGVGIDGQEGGRNSPASYNRLFSTLQFWDGRAGSVEEQAIGPIANPIEMGNTHAKAVETLKKIPGYKMQFDKIFGESGVTIENVGKAIAAFERVVITGPSAFDYYEKLKPFAQFEKEDFEDDPELKAEFDRLTALAKKKPMSESAIRGRKLFFDKRINCAACHVGANLTDELYHNLGVGMKAEKPDLGRYAVTKKEKDKGAFKTPTIRNVALTAPYMHDGSQKTLMDVVEHYNKGGEPNEFLSEKIVKLNLTEQEKKDLVAFMEACTGDLTPVETGRLPE